MRPTAPAVLQEAAGAPHRLRLAGVLRECRDLGPVVGRGRLNAQHRADEALADAAVLHRRAPVLHRRAPVLGGAHERPVREAAAREELGHVEPIEAAPEEEEEEEEESLFKADAVNEEERFLLVLGQALELVDRTRECMNGICKTVATGSDLWNPGPGFTTVL